MGASLRDPATHEPSRQGVSALTGECPLRVLSLFAGIGGFDLGLERTGGFKTVAFCEIDPFCRRVLAKHWPGVPCYDDVRTLTADRLAADGIAVDVICGGFPCQPHSTASRGRRVAVCLWGEMYRLIVELRPGAIIAENVLGLGDDGVDRVCDDLEQAGYTVWPLDLETAPAGRQRGRPRLVFVAYADSQGQPRRAIHEEVARIFSVPGGSAPDIPAPLGVDDGLPHRMDRLGALGNAVTPWATELIGRAILASREAG